MPETTSTEWLWEITTEDAVYLIDLDQSTVIRLPAVLPDGSPRPDAAQLPQDGQPIPLLSIGRVQTSSPLVLGLGIRADDTPTMHTTTPVQLIRTVGGPGLEPERTISGQITRLHPAMAGSWIVHTLTSNHRWDLDQNTITRIPGPGATPMPYDHHPMALSDVVIWPEVGSQAYVMCHHPDDPNTYLWRICATVTAITTAPDRH